MSTAVKERKEELIYELNNLGIYKTEDGRQLTEVSLYTLEWTHIDEKNKAARAYVDQH
ncbi:Fur-regulated basic protein FbpA [Virgibacillus halodenitrificans]|uniref:Fur-regulated basic protein FbpA n=1 Tax=Virgibacillus halodenitrificans TaxID=1482 RepID=A0ABR7VMZ0_VIRHA|nr:Fur-regulated basic protein FbpA [Virgibacillus halodenitrificans]MBD1223270.1 Fur-regulated basic protein FbpA [Virgibacillus halodenitrificans]